MSATRKILVVDDDPDTIAYLVTLLEDNGYETMTAPNGEEGLKKAKESPPDLILLDTRAPHWFPRHDLAAGIVYAAHPGDEAYVWADGRLLYRQGEYLTLDVERIRREAERRAFRMVGRPMQQVREYQG